MKGPGIVGYSAFAVLLFASCLASSAQACTNPDFAANAFISKWNARVTTDKLGPAWHLAKYNGFGSFQHNLDRSDLWLAAQVDKVGCITRVDIKSRRADANGYAALVAWSTLIIVTNPSLPKDQRKAIFTALGLDKQIAGGSYAVGHVSYKFVESEEENDFSAAPE